MADVLRFATLLSLYVGVLSLLAQRRSSRLWQWDQHGEAWETRDFGGRKLAAFGGQGHGLLRRTSMVLSGGEASACNLQYTSVVYLHSAADRDDSKWCFKKVQVSSAKLSDANGISNMIAKIFSRAEVTEGLKVCRAMSLSRAKKITILQWVLMIHSTQQFFGGAAVMRIAAKEASQGRCPTFACFEYALGSEHNHKLGGVCAIAGATNPTAAEFLIVLFAELFEIYSGCSSHGVLEDLFVLPCRIPHIRLGMTRGRLFVIAHAGVGPLSGKGPRVIVFADASVLPRITSLKCVLTQEHLDAICAKYFVPEEVHPKLPSTDATMHERPTSKIGMYTRFFDYANYQMDLNAFIRTADPRKVRIVERARAENERPIVHRWEIVGDASVGDGGDQGFDSVAGQDNVEPTVPVTEPVKAKIPRPKRSKKKRVTYDSEGLPVAPRFSINGRTGCSSSSYLTLYYFFRDSFTFGGGRRTDAKSADPEVDSLVRSAAPVMTEATTVATVATIVAFPADFSKDKSAPHPFIFGSSSSSEKTDRTLSLFTGRSGSGFDAWSIRAEEAVGVGSEEIYVPEWTVTKGFELNDRRLCANMIDHFTLPAFFKTVREMEHEQLFTEFNVSAARNLSLSSEVRMRAEYNILEKRKWRSLAEEKNILLEAKDKEIEDLKSQLLKAKEESTEVTQLRAQVSGLEATENSLQGKVASAKDHNVLLEQECNSLKLKVTGLESTIAEKDHELSDLGASSSSLKSQNQSLVNQVHELEISSADLREKLEMYEGSLKQLEEFQDNLMGPLRTRLAEIDADFTRCCMRFQESFHPHLLNVVAGRRWLLTHGMKLLVVKCLNSNEYMEALGHAFGRAIEKGMQEGLAAGIEHGQAGRCLTDLEAYIPSAEDDFNSAIRNLRDLNFPLLQSFPTRRMPALVRTLPKVRTSEGNIDASARGGPYVFPLDRSKPGIGDAVL
ncbi:hypothetical protein Tco_0537288 [Tanacetum coccineum]